MYLNTWREVKLDRGFGSFPQFAWRFGTICDSDILDASQTVGSSSGSDTIYVSRIKKYFH